MGGPRESQSATETIQRDEENSSKRSGETTNTNRWMIIAHCSCACYVMHGGLCVRRTESDMSKNQWMSMWVDGWKSVRGGEWMCSGGWLEKLVYARVDACKCMHVNAWAWALMNVDGCLCMPMDNLCKGILSDGGLHSSH